MEDKYGISCEVIDARSIVPFNYAKVIESVKKTRKILLASDACERGSALQTMAAKITQFAFDELDAPPVVVGARNWITPADEVEDAFFPLPGRHHRRRPRAHPAAQGLQCHPRLLQCRPVASERRRHLRSRPQETAEVKERDLNCEVDRTNVNCRPRAQKVSSTSARRKLSISSCT